MGLHVDSPDPPTRDTGIDASEYDDAGVVGDDDYRREELEEYLETGAWSDAWHQ